MKKSYFSQSAAVFFKDGFILRAYKLGMKGENSDVFNKSEKAIDYLRDSLENCGYITEKFQVANGVLSLNI